MEERAARAQISSDACVIDDQWFFIRAQIEIPIHGYDELFVWGVWVSISEKSFESFTKTYESAGREKEEPLFAWLTSVPRPYPSALLKANVHLRPYPTRPWIELEPTEHPLAVDQREGITAVRAQEIAEKLLHPRPKGFAGEVTRAILLKDDMGLVVSPMED